MNIFPARRRAYVSTGVNFLIGAILGIVLFYGQQKCEGFFEKQSFFLEKNITLTDFFQLAWLNLLWLIAILISSIVAPHTWFHPIMLARGAVCNFSVCCLLEYCAVKDAIAAVIPQCFSILPVMTYVSGLYVLKIEKMRKNTEPITRRELILLTFLALISAGAETILYNAFLKITG